MNDLPTTPSSSELLTPPVEPLDVPLEALNLFGVSHQISQVHPLLEEIDVKQALLIWYMEYGVHLKSKHVLLKQMKHSVRKLGQIPVKHLTALDLSDFKNDRLSKVGPQTVIHELSVINRALHYLADEKGYRFPHGVPRTKNPKRPRGRDRRLRGDELGEILRHMPDNRMRLLVLFLLATGLRRGEAIKSEWSELNWQTRTLHIPETKTGIPRTIPLSSNAMGILESVRRSFDVEERIFPYKSPDCATQAFYKAKLKAGRPDLRLHDLRHEAVSGFFERGLNVMEVASISGHRDLASLKRYTHLKAEHLVEKLG